MPQQNEKAQVQLSKWLIKYACLQTCLLYVLSKDEVGLKNARHTLCFTKK